MVDEKSEQRIGVAALAEQIKGLVASHAEVKTLLRDISTAMQEAERRAAESCKTCAMWARVNGLEKEMAGINGRIAGVSLAAGALAFLGSMFVRK